jgi:hypothetical protein
MVLALVASVNGEWQRGQPMAVSVWVAKLLPLPRAAAAAVTTTSTNVLESQSSGAERD